MKTELLSAEITVSKHTSNNLLDVMLEELMLKNDAALARVLIVAPPVISKIRHNRLSIGASMLIRMHEITGWRIQELRRLMGDNAPYFQQKK